FFRITSITILKYWRASGCRGSRLNTVMNLLNAAMYCPFSNNVLPSSSTTSLDGKARLVLATATGIGSPVTARVSVSALNAKEKVKSKRKKGKRGKEKGRNRGLV